MKTFVDCDCFDGCTECHGTGQVEAFECASGCGSLVERDGSRCIGCSARLDTAIDHRDFPDRVIWR